MKTVRWVGIREGVGTLCVFAVDFGDSRGEFAVLGASPHDGEVLASRLGASYSQAEGVRRMKAPWDVRPSEGPPSLSRGHNSDKPAPDGSQGWPEKDPHGRCWVCADGNYGEFRAVHLASGYRLERISAFQCRRCGTLWAVGARPGEGGSPVK